MTGNSWKMVPTSVQHAVEDYLIQQLCCVVRQHHQGFHLVFKTDQTHRAVRMFLSGLKLFYQIMGQQGYYGHPNPLIDPGASTVQLIEAQDEEGESVPRMPARSGVVEPSPRRKPRLSDSYFKLEDEQRNSFFHPTSREKYSLVPHFAAMRAQAHLRYNCLVRLRQAYQKAVAQTQRDERTFPVAFSYEEGSECWHFRL